MANRGTRKNSNLRIFEDKKVCGIPARFVCEGINIILDCRSSFVWHSNIMSPDFLITGPYFHFFYLTSEIGLTGEKSSSKMQVH